MNRKEHLFLFSAVDIAKAAEAEAEYHEERKAYWERQYDLAVGIVEQTAGAKVEKRPVTGGYAVDVVVDYGDPAAYRQMQRSFSKINSHREEAEAFRTDERVCTGPRALECTNSTLRTCITSVSAASPARTDRRDTPNREEVEL